jgi:hypothetical protein
MALLAAAPLAPFSFASGSFGKILSATVYPNPFDSRGKNATIEYRLDADSPVALTVYNVFGRRVLERTFAPAASGGRRGVNRVFWDGKGASGIKVSKGIYLTVIRAGKNLEILKVGVIH